MVLTEVLRRRSKIWETEVQRGFLLMPVKFSDEPKARRVQRGRATEGSEEVANSGVIFLQQYIQDFQVSLLLLPNLFLLQEYGLLNKQK